MKRWLMFVIVFGCIEIAYSDNYIENQYDNALRHKRDNAGENCAKNAVQSFNADVEKNGTGLNFTGHAGLFRGKQFFTQLNTESLDKFCKIYWPYRKALANCSDSKTKTTSVKIFGIFDFICIEKYKELKEQLPCFQKIDRNVAQNCSAQCINDTKAHASGANGTKGEKEFYSRFCSRLNCLILCQSPIIKKTCGQKAVDLVHEAVQFTFKRLNSLNEDQTSSSAKWPQECKDLATKSFPS